MGKRGLLVLIGLLAVGACLWWIAGGGRSQGTPGVPARASADHVKSAPLLAEPSVAEAEGIGGGRTAEALSVVEERPVAHATDDSADGEMSPAEGTLIVRVLRSDTGEPVPGERVVLMAQDPQVGETSGGWSRTEKVATYVEGSDGTFGDAPRADQNGRCTFRIPAGVGARALALRAFATHNGAGEVLVEPLAAGETRELTLLMPVFQVWIRVESADDGASIAGARARAQDGDQEVSTGIDGLAVMWCSDWRNERLDIEAEGYAPAYVQLKRGHEQPQEALVVQLTQAACLSGRVVDEADKPISGAKVSVVADGWDLSPNKLSPWETSGSITLIEDRTWSERSDASGVFTLCGLTPAIPLKVTVSKGARLRLNVADPVQLASGEKREVLYRLGGGAIVKGVVRDEAGKPVSRCKLWLKAEGESFGKSYSSVERTLRSKLDGTFELKDVPPGEWFLGPTLDSGYLPEPTTVKVAEGTDSVEVVVEARAAFFIAGRVLGPTGEPVPDVFIYALGDGGSGESGPDGAFRVGPIKAGRVALDVIYSQTDMFLPEPLDIEAGQENVELRLVLGGRLAGRLVDAATDEPTEGTITLSVGSEMARLAHANPSGEFAFKGLRPGSYGLTGRSPDGSAGFLEHVEVAGPGVGGEELVLRLAPGGKLALRFPPEVNCLYRARSGECVHFFDYYVGPEDVVTPHLPTGGVTVELLGPDGALLLSREATVRAGETVLVDLSKHP